MASASSSSSGQRDSGRKKIGQDFPCPLIYQNKLPPLPFEPKLLAIPGQLERHYKEPIGSIHSSTPLPLNGRDLDNGHPPRPVAMGLVWEPENQVRSAAKLEDEDLQLLTPCVEPKKQNPIQAARPVASWLMKRIYEQRPSDSTPKPQASR
ncbi:hypothetical protein HK405_015073, partial [Cladochytrium tenue]